MEATEQLLLKEYLSIMIANKKKRMQDTPDIFYGIDANKSGTLFIEFLIKDKNKTGEKIELTF